MSGLVFGASITLCFAVVALTLMGVLVSENSGNKLTHLLLPPIVNVTLPINGSAQLLNDTANLSLLVGEKGADCSDASVLNVNRTNTLASLSAVELAASVGYVVGNCTNRIAILQQAIAQVGMELTPNTPTVLQSGTLTVQLDGSPSVLGLGYSLNHLVLGGQLNMVYLLLQPWGLSIDSMVTSTTLLTMYDFVPILTNLGECGAGPRPLLLGTGIERFVGNVEIDSIELDCDGSTGFEIEFQGPGVLNPGTIELVNPLMVLLQFV